MPKTLEEKYEYWYELAQYDLGTAEAMLVSKRWLYVVFMCQQAIEKLVKGLYTLYVSDDVPRTHNIRALAERLETKLETSVSAQNYALFDRLSSYYLNNRYPDFLNDQAGQIGAEETNTVLLQTKEVFTWLLGLKK